MPPAPASPEQLLVFTDLDGSLLDPVTYSWDNAREALEQLSSREIPLILVSSKTRAEIEPLRLELQHRHPFITENGGAIFIPQGYFMSVSQEARIREGFEVIELGAPYASLLRALRDIEHAAGIQLRGFHDMTVDEVATRTGLTLDEAELAMRREYDEPFIIEGPPSLLPVIQREAAERQLSVTTGGRFHHLLGESDKGRACLHLLDRYRRHWHRPPKSIRSIGLGDSANDHPMLEVVDVPIAIQRADGSYDPDLHVAHLIKARGVGPVGWNSAVLDQLAPPPARTRRRRQETKRPAPPSSR
ncbi:mannosyl-3-phosphoglycerate phosphatase [Nitrospira sp.]|nr:mannosyl-3-phosphoglycerate phosphatase [Nitrospira sp.]